MKHICNLYCANFKDMKKLNVSTKFVRVIKDVILSYYGLSLAARRLDGNRNMIDSDVCNVLTRYTLHECSFWRVNLFTYLIRDVKYSKAVQVIEEFLMSGAKLLINCESCSIFNGITLTRATYLFTSFRCS